MKAKSIFRILLDMLLLAAGSFVAAFAIEEFLAPCLILDGGVVGISMIISTLYRWQLGIVTIV